MGLARKTQRRLENLLAWILALGILLLLVAGIAYVFQSL